MTRLRSTALLLVLMACEGTPPLAPIERWAADLTQTDEVLFMAIVSRESEVSGTGALGNLTNVGSEPLTVSGTRIGDSISIKFHREVELPFTFDGRYIGPGIGGILHGAHFDSTPTLFRRR